MPEFQLDYGTPKGANAYRQLDSFTQGYVEAMFFTSTGYQEDEDLGNATVADLSPEAWVAIKADCHKFQEANANLLEQAYENEVTTYDDERAGRDFWFTRNGHGTGFWDRDLGPLGDQLTEAAHQLREQDLYRGDDGQLYLG